MRVETRIVDIDSSQISRMDYVWQSDEPWKLKMAGHLRVTFANGQRYIYENVPYIIVMNIAADESPGSAFNHFIKGGDFKYYKDGEVSSE